MADPKLDATGKPVAKTQAEIASRYAFNYSIIEADPGLKAWWTKFVKQYTKSKGQVTYDTFKLGLDQVPWWNEHSATYIQDVRREMDPTTKQDYAQGLASDMETVKQNASTMGATIDDAIAKALVQNARRFGWNETQQKKALAAYVTASPTGATDYNGLAGTTQDELSKWVQANGVSLSSGLMDGYVKDVVAGNKTLDDIKGDIRRTYLAGAYPAWADKINAGFDPSDIFSPYVDNARALLEDKSISLKDPIMQKITQATGTDGKPAAIPLYEAQRMIRQDPRWQKTDNAYSTYASVGTDLLKMFGFA